MGHTHFLVQSGVSQPSNLPNAISNLEDASTLFTTHWHQGNLERAGNVSSEALKIFDFLANEILRTKVERNGANIYLNRTFRTEMQKHCGSSVTNTSLQQQQSMVNSGPGNGRIAQNLGNPTPLTYDRLLNKIKHRSPSLMNFRIENGRHIFVFCSDHTQGGAEGIYEFDVIEFCKMCRNVANAL